MDNNEDENFWNTFFDDSNFNSESLQTERNKLERALSRNSPEREEQTFKCPKCDNSFSSKYNLSRHVKKGICEKEAPFICKNCGKVFRKQAFLKRHTDRGKCLRQHPRKTGTKPSRLTCNMCNQTFMQVSNLKRHRDRKVCVNKTLSKDEVFTCRHCGKIFRTAFHLRNYVDRTHSGPYDRPDDRRQTNGNPRIEPPGSDSENDNNEEEFERGPLRQYRRTLFQGRMTRYRLPAVEAERHDMLFFFANRRHQLKDNLVRERRRYMSVKWYMSVKVEMERIDATGEIADEAAPVFQSGSRILVNDGPIDDQINDAFLKMQRSFDTFKATGSGWRMKSAEHMEQSVIKFIPLGGSCFNYKIREGLSRKQCLLNITGPPELDGECFKYSILGALYTDESVVGDVPWSNFHPYKNSLTFDGIKESGKHMPVTSIPCFERANNISINLYGYANHAFPIHISSYIDDGPKHIDLLLLEGREGDGMGGGFDTDEEEEGSICQTIADNRSPHYCVIKDLGRLVASDGGNGKRRTFVCRRCLALRPDLESLRWHEKKMCRR